MKLGFIGLGQMGKPMALNILRSGDQLIVYARKTAAFPEFVARGARATTDLAEVAQADIIFLCLPGSQAVQDVVLGEQGLSSYLTAGQIIVDFSTIKYTTTIEIAKCLAERSIVFIDAPITGMEARAVAGTLTVMCGGIEETVAVVKPYLECIGDKVIYMGGSGSGQLTKLMNQLLLNINLAGLAEVLPLAVKMGLDPEKVGQVVNSGTGRSYASEFFVSRILAGNFSEGYPLQNAYKDLISAAEISANLCIPLPVLHAATTTYQMALLKGYGEQDKGAMINVFEDLLGIKYRNHQE